MRKPRLFVSYATRDPRDSQLARELTKELRSQQFDVWFAEESISPGQEWESQIVREISIKCSHFIVVLSAASVDSDYVRKETQLALERFNSEPQFQIIPLLIGDLDHERLVGQLNRFHAIKYQASTSSLVAQVIKALEKSDGAHICDGQIFEERTDPWQGILRSILQDTIPKQLASRRPWIRSEQERVFRKLLSNRFLKGISKTKKWTPVLSPILDSGSLDFDPSIYDLEIVKWSDKLVAVCSAPATMAFAAVGIYVRDYLHKPLQLNFSYPHGVAIVEAINRGTIEPDAFAAGDSQIAWLRRPYSWTLAFGVVHDRTMAPTGTSSPSTDGDGTFLVTEGSTLEMAYENYVESGKIDRKRIVKRYVEPSEALAAISLKDSDPSQRAILWPPNWRIAELSGRARALEELSTHSWNSTLYFSERILLQDEKLVDGVCAAYLLGWHRLRSDRKIRDAVIEKLASDDAFSNSARSSAGYDLIFAPAATASGRPPT